MVTVIAGSVRRWRGRGSSSGSYSPIVDAFLSGALAKITVGLMSAAIVAVTVRSVGASGYGVVAVFVGFVSVAGFLDLGIGNGVISALSGALERDDRQDASRIVSSALVVLVAISLVILIVGIPSAFLIPTGALFDAPGVSLFDLRLSICVFILSTAVSLPSILGSRVCLALQRGALNNAYIASGTFLSLVGALLAWWLVAPVWVFVAVAMLPPALVSVFQTIRFVGRRQQFFVVGLEYVTRGSVRYLMSTSGSFFVLGVCASISLQSSVTVVAYVLDAAAAGTLAAGLRMFSIITGLFVSGIQQGWASMARAFARRDRAWVRRSSSLMIAGTTLVVSLLSTVMVIAGVRVAHLWVGDGVVLGRGLLALIAVYTLYSFVMTQFSYILNAARFVAPQALVSSVSVALQVPLAIYLTSTLGVGGPIYAFLICHCSLVAIPTLLWVRRFLSNSEEV